EESGMDSAFSKYDGRGRAVLQRAGPNEMGCHALHGRDIATRATGGDVEAGKTELRKRISVWAGMVSSRREGAPVALPHRRKSGLFHQHVSLRGRPADDHCAEQYGRR